MSAIPNYDDPAPIDDGYLRGLDRQSDDSTFLDWHDLFTDDDVDEGWLYEGVFALGRGHAVYAQHKQGKSLFVLWVAVELATKRTDVDVVYLDYEMTRADVRERLEDMGYGLDSDLSRLHYALLPSIGPLDSMEGAGELLALIDSVHVEGRHVFVVIDTTARAAQGKENDADTFRNFYRCTGIVLKRRGITYTRLDHAGKDGARGQRGSSGKGDDVDIIWKLITADAGMKLQRDAARMSWVEETVSFAMATDPLRYVRGTTWPAGTKALAIALDGLGLPLDISGRKARSAMREAGIKGTNDVLYKALQYRHQLHEMGPESAPDEKRSTPEAAPTEHPTEHPTNNALTSTERSTERDGALSAVASGAPVSLDTARYARDPSDGLDPRIDSEPW